MDITIKEMAEQLMKRDELCIIYHIRPDGDCIGSAYALCLGLQSMGKKCMVMGQDEVPRAYRFMTDNVTFDELKDPVYTAVDSAAIWRVGVHGDKHFTFCIDHHYNTFEGVDYRHVERECGACGEIIYKLLKEMGVTITKDIAELLYAAIVTDTNCFRTSDTHTQTFEIAAALCEAGADIYNVGRKCMFIKQKGRIKLEDTVRRSFHYTCDDKVLSAVIKLSDLDEAGVLDSDLEGINSLTEQVEGVRIGVTIRELPDGSMRCSTRTNGDISANEICRTHGGGGHFHAACCELTEDAETARRIMEETAREFLEKGEAHE